MAKFIRMKDGGYLNAAHIRRVVPDDNWEKWTAYGADGERIGVMEVEKHNLPNTVLAEVIPAAPGFTYLVVNDDEDGIWHELSPIIGWRCGPDYVEPVLIEQSCGHGALLTAISMPDGGWCAPEDATWPNLEAALNTARARLKRKQEAATLEASP
jgi:hypothetical protein